MYLQLLTVPRSRCKLELAWSEFNKAGLGLYLGGKSRSSQSSWPFPCLCHCHFRPQRPFPLLPGFSCYHFDLQTTKEFFLCLQTDENSMPKLLPNVLLSVLLGLWDVQQEIPIKSVFNAIIFMQISVSVLLVEPKNYVYPLGMFHWNHLFLAQMTTQTFWPNVTLLSAS